MKIDLTIESDSSCGLNPQSLESVSNDILAKLNIKKPHSTIEVFLVEDNKIRSLNKQHRNKDEATDVLSFPQEQFPTKNEQILGTIFIAPEFAKNQQVDCNELFIHGFLHMLGFDHETNLEDWKKVEEKIGRKTI